MTRAGGTGRQAVAEIAGRHGVSEAAAAAALEALRRGHGRVAQFDHPELGGMGQWSEGGMIQIGEMFNDGLKRKVAALCADLAAALDEGDGGGGAERPEPAGGESWWPAELGRPSSTGGQNDAAYALFADQRRLAVKQGGTVRVYDSGDHRISGFSQQQGGGGQTLRFSSQHGQIDTGDLRRVD